MASPPRNPLPAAVGDVHNNATGPEPADPNLVIIVHPVNLEAVPISYIEPGDELNSIDPDNFEFVGPSSTTGRFPTRRSKRMNPFPDLNTAGSQRRRGGNSPRRGGRDGRRGGRGGRTPVRPNPPRGLHLVDEDTDDEEGDPTFAEPEAQALSSSSSESSSKDSPPPVSTQGETSQPNMAATASQHPVSEGVAAHVPEDAAAPTVSTNVPQSAAEDAAPYQDEEMPDFSGMSSAEHVDIPTVDAQDFTTTEETPSAPHADPLETLAEAAVQVDVSPPQAEEPEKSDDSWEKEEDAAPPVASPEPAYIPDELEDSEDEDSSEEEEPDLDGKDLSTPFEVNNAFSPTFYFESDSNLSPQIMNCQFIEEKKISKEEFDRHRITVFLHQRKILSLVEVACSYDPTVVKEFYANLQTSFLKKNSPNFGKVYLTHSLTQITYHQSMVDMLQKALSDQKEEKRLVMKLKQGLLTLWMPEAESKESVKKEQRMKEKFKEQRKAVDPVLMMEEQQLILRRLWIFYFNYFYEHC
ncbi:PREDICTED: uncharacterized protein LOC105967214 [Erythranthe guttata]|uniref:uncharacterized protein LOC105967214 n=1 Tax=Erythranthe guttata TaxID=4155 RepID=UPI00064D8584|nr:PREDICTED: uncharacterized protein LOC105967214 [Erythranthe guttata]|eukprot:XP_012847269.1 PREDICTED: uncharacterized protein LOC105967214 [Erythranthe guttata]